MLLPGNKLKKSSGKIIQFSSAKKRKNWERVAQAYKHGWKGPKEGLEWVLGILKSLKEGGAGSGNFGHAGRPGERGGSGAGGGDTGGAPAGFNIVKYLQPPTDAELARHAALGEPSPTFDSVKNTLRAEFNSKGERGSDQWYVHNAAGSVIGPKYSLSDIKLIGKQTLVVKVYSDYVRMPASGAMKWDEWHKEHIASIQKAVPGAEVTHSGTKVEYINRNPEFTIDTYRVRSPKPITKTGNETLRQLVLSVLKEGGSGSGNFGHLGRPGERGGSGGGTGGSVGDPQERYYALQNQAATAASVARAHDDLAKATTEPISKAYLTRLANKYMRMSDEYVDRSNRINQKHGLGMEKAKYHHESTLSPTKNWKTEVQKRYETHKDTEMNSELKKIFKRVTANLREGGAGSGNFGHAGRPGERGGSGGGGGGEVGAGGKGTSADTQNTHEFLAKSYAGGKAEPRADQVATQPPDSEHPFGGYMVASDSGEPYTYCHNDQSLDQWAKEGGWEGKDDFLKDMALDRSEVVGQWFMTIEHSTYVVNPGDKDHQWGTRKEAKRFIESVVQHALAVRKRIFEGGPGSGNFGHAGRAGERGGSGGGGGGGESSSKESEWDKQGVQRPGNTPHEGYEIGRGWYSNLNAFKNDVAGSGVDYNKERLVAIVNIHSDRWPGGAPQKAAWVKAAETGLKNAESRKAEMDKEFQKERSAELRKRSGQESLVRHALAVRKRIFEGGAGSGNFGHAGRAGERGGSGSGGTQGELPLGMGGTTTVISHPAPSAPAAPAAAPAPEAPSTTIYPTGTVSTGDMSKLGITMNPEEAKQVLSDPNDDGYEGEKIPYLLPTGSSMRFSNPEGNEYVAGWHRFGGKDKSNAVVYHFLRKSADMYSGEKGGRAVLAASHGGPKWKIGHRIEAYHDQSGNRMGSYVHVGTLTGAQIKANPGLASKLAGGQTSGRVWTFK